MLTGLLMWQPAIAQSMVEVQWAGKAFVDSRQGPAEICGFSFASTGGKGTDYERSLVNVAILLSKAGVSVKLNGFELPHGKSGVRELVPRPIYGGWVKAEGKDKASPIPPFYNGLEKPNSKFFRVTPDAGAEVINSIVKKDVIQIAVNWQPNIESIYFGRVDIKEAQVDQFYKCVDGIEAMNSTTGSTLLPTSIKIAP